MKLLQPGNQKLHNQYMFNIITSKEVCGRECPGCYSLREQKRFPTSVVPARESRYEAAKRKDFAQCIIAEINAIKKPFKAIRLHASGEFFSQAYINSWTSIASTLPSTKFYAFTKRLKDFDFTSLQALPNFILIDSLQSGGLNYDKLANLDQSRFICPSTLDKTKQCGIDCDYCWTSQAAIQTPQFVKH